MLPQGMFSVAIATVLFPTLSRLAARGDMDGFRRHGRHGPAPDRVPARPRQRRSSAVLAEPIMRILFQRGHFTAPDARRRRRLAAFSAGLVFNGAMLMLNRAFFSLQSNWVPTVVALGNLVPERRARLRLLPVRHLGDPALDRRRATSPARWRCSSCCAAGSAGSRAARSRATVLGSASRRRSSPASPGASGGRSTPRSAARSPARSSRSASRSRPRSRRICSAAGSLQRARARSARVAVATPAPPGADRAASPDQDRTIDACPLEPRSRVRRGDAGDRREHRVAPTALRPRLDEASG